MRSLTQAALVLLFMFRASWRLTVITFILIPLSVSVSKTFGTWFRRAPVSSPVSGPKPCPGQAGRGLHGGGRPAQPGAP